MPRGVDPIDEARLQGRLWTPALIQTAIWLDAADPSTISSPSGISEWRDKSGNGRNASQSTAANRPSYVEVAENGNSAIRFDGTNDVLKTGGPSGLPTSGTSSRSLFVVYKPRSTPSEVSFSMAGQGEAATTGTWFKLQARNNSFATGDPYFAGYASDLTDNTTLNTKPKIAAISFNGTNGFLFRNGKQIASGSLSLTTTTDFIYIGASNTTQEFANADIMEIIFVSQAVTSRTRFLIEGYLGWKWNSEKNYPLIHSFDTSEAHPFLGRPPLIGD